MPRARVREARGELRPFQRTDVRGAPSEISAGCCLHTVEARPELHDVEVELQDALLGQRALELPGEEQLAHLSERIPGGRQPQVLRELLRDGRRASRSPPPLDGPL